MILDCDSRCSAYNANDVPAVFHKILCFVSWQAQYLVILDGVSCCSVQCKMTPMPFSTQKPLLVQSHFSWQAQYFGMLEESWLLFALTARMLYRKMHYFALRISLDLAEYCACHEKWQLNTPNFAVHTTECATWMQRHQILRLPRGVTGEFHQILDLPRKMPMELHQILHLPRKLSVQLECNFTKYCECHEKCTSLLHYHSFTFFFDCTIFSKIYKAFALPFFDSTFFCSTILWFYFSFTLLFLDSSMLLPVSLTLLFFYSTILWLY